MRSVNHKDHQQGSELYPQIDRVILDYLSGGRVKDVQAIVNYIRENIFIRLSKYNEQFVQYAIKMRLDQANSQLEIQKLNKKINDLTDNILSFENELDAIYSRKGVLTVSSTGVIESVNDLMLEISGYSREELIGENINIMSSGLHSDEFWKDFYSTIRSGKVWEGEIINRGKDKSIINLWTLVIPLIDGSGFRVIRRDISETKMTAEILDAIQNNKIDALTNLPTHKQMHLDYADSLPERISVVHINDLRELNMAYGDLSPDSHVDIGGMILRKIAKLLKKYAEEHKGLGVRIYKLTGPDFAITYEINREQEFFDKMYEKMNTLQLGNFGVLLDSGKNLTIQPSFSFGVALEGANIKSFLSNAISALAVSKGQNNSIAIYQDNNDAKMTAKGNIEMKQMIKNALLNPQGFVIEFQPIVEVLSFYHIGKLFRSLLRKKDKDAIKYEVLVRMVDPNDPSKYISPGAFLSLIEADKQNIQLTTRVINLACEFMVDNPGHYSINITAEDLNMVGRAKMITEQIEKYGISLSRFTFEILENIEFLTPVALDNINFFDKKGALIAIDDYGTGFSSVPRLRRLRAHFLKLDMSLIRGIDTNLDNRADVKSAIKIAHKMGAEVIAEGVETEAEKRVLIELGIDHLQGYLIGRPMPHI